MRIIESLVREISKIAADRNPEYLDAERKSERNHGGMAADLRRSAITFRNPLEIELIRGRLEWYIGVARTPNEIPLLQQFLNEIEPGEHSDLSSAIKSMIGQLSSLSKVIENMSDADLRDECQLVANDLDVLAEEFDKSQDFDAQRLAEVTVRLRTEKTGGKIPLDPKAILRSRHQEREAELAEYEMQLQAAYKRHENKEKFDTAFKRMAEWAEIVRHDSARRGFAAEIVKLASTLNELGYAEKLSAIQDRFAEMLHIDSTGKSFG